MKVFGFAEFDEVADKQIQPSVVVVVEPHRARGPSGSRDAGLFRNVSEGSVAVVVIQNASSILGHVQIGKAVAVIVAHGDTLPVAAGRDAGLLRDVGEGSISIVAIERVAQRRIGIVEVTLAAVDEIDVHPSVIVVIEKGAACPGGFRQVLLRRLAGGMYPGDVAGGRGYFFEGIGRREAAPAKRRATQRIRQRRPGSGENSGGITVCYCRSLRSLGSLSACVFRGLLLQSKFPLRIFFASGARVGGRQAVVPSRIAGLKFDRFFQRSNGLGVLLLG